MRHGIGKLGGIHSAQIQSKGKKYTAGLYRRQFTGYPNQNTSSPGWFAGKTPAANAVTNDFEITLADTVPNHNIAYEWTGYFLPSVTSSTWAFTTNATTIDDCVTLWVGNNALSGYNSANSTLDISNTQGGKTGVSLTAGVYYPIRVQFANNIGPGRCTLAWSTNNGTTVSTNWAGKLFYNAATNGF